MQIMHFTPPQIAKYFTVNESTIKRWIQSGKLPAGKTVGGHYRVSKVQMNSFLSKYEEHVSSSYVLKRLLEQKQNRNQNWLEYYENLYKNNPDKAVGFLRMLYVQGHTLAEVFDQIIIPTLQHMGREWRDGRLEINMEHRMSFIISQHISTLNDFILVKKNIKTKDAILACVPGNTHILPIFMGDAILKQHNFNREVLGINISVAEIEKVINRNSKTKLVCVSKTYSSLDNSSYLRKIISITKNKGIDLVLSGNGWNNSELKIIQENKVKSFKSLVEFDNYLQAFK